MPEARVQSLIQEDPLEKKMATQPSILACRIPWTEEPGRLQYSPWGRTESDTTEWLTLALLVMVAVFSLSRNCQTVFQSDCTILLSHQQCKRRSLQLLCIFANTCCYLSLILAILVGCEVIPHCDICFSFTWWVKILSTFSYVYWLFSHLWNSYSGPLPIFKLGFILLLNYNSSLYVLGTSPSSEI